MKGPSSFLNLTMYHVYCLSVTYKSCNNLLLYIQQLVHKQELQEVLRFQLRYFGTQKPDELGLKNAPIYIDPSSPLPLVICFFMKFCVAQTFWVERHLDVVLEVLQVVGSIYHIWKTKYSRQFPKVLILETLKQTNKKYIQPPV